MSPASPLSARKSLLRRLTAGMLGAALGLMLIVEPLLADVCDGDAPASARAAVIPHEDFGEARSAPGTQSQVNVVGAALAGEDATPGIPAIPNGSTHDVHVCHCVHVHGGTLGSRFALSASTVPDTDAVAPSAERVPPSAALEPPLRPPAPPHAS